MGSCSSTTQINGSNSVNSQDRKSMINTNKTYNKIREALKIKLEADGDSNKLLTLERILLKFEKMHSYMKNIKVLFNELSHDQKVLSLDGFIEAMNVLHGNVSKDDVVDLFAYVDVDGSHKINLKEFLCVLTVALVLKIIPAFVQNKESTRDDGTSIRESVSFMHGDNNEIKNMLELIVIAYLRFDPDCEGYIRADRFTQVLEDQGQVQNKAITPGKGSKNVSQLKWKEMDFDKDNKIDFAEFVYSFSKWVDIDDDIE